ncbi:MAG TPA: ATP-binding protein [Longimicrobiales bacterium]|nr:ATP-binding protein [Longimicrobiales bacterium]
MSWTTQLRRLSLRMKILITVVGAGFAVLGASTYLSFTYWQREAHLIAEQQALLAAKSARLSIEGALNRGDQAAAQRTLKKLVRGSAVTAVRVHDNDNRVVLSSIESELALPRSRVWIPSAGELSSEGTARVYEEDGRHAVHAFIPIGSRMQNVLEVELSMSVVATAMERGSRLGIGLFVVSLLVVGLVLYAMIQREVVQPFLAVEKLAEERRVLLEERAGFAEVGELAAEMAHEFKRPLASIRSAVELLEQEYTLPSHGQMLLGGIESQLERLSDTMHDVFGLAKPVGIETEPVDLGRILDNALMQVSAAAQAAQVVIERDYPNSITIQADARRLELVFTNLLNNAIDAMSPDGGTLIVRAHTHDGQTVVEIRDTGIGIEAAHLADVMRPFYSTKTTGTGLGLPLAARIVRAHGGDLRLESTKGVGTTVYVMFGAAQSLEDKSWEARAS